MITDKDFLSVCHRLELPEEACEFFLQAYNTIRKTDGCMDALRSAENAMINCKGDFSKVEPFLNKASELSGICRRSLDMAFRIITVPDVVKLYEAKNVPEKIIWDTLADINYELIECHRVYGDWGSFVLWFYPRLFAVNLFRIGRLEYETHDNDDLMNIHISSCGRLEMDDIIASLKEAYKYFGYGGNRPVMKLVADTWLLYPPMKDIFPEGSNLKKFHDLFKVITHTEETNEDMWYIFWKPVDTPIDELPEDTRLQRNAKAWLKAGNSLGISIGRIDFDGEKFVQPGDDR